MILAILIAAGAVVGSVYLHLLALLTLRAYLRRHQPVTHFTVIAMVVGAVIAHLLEIALFASGLVVLAHHSTPREAELIAGHLDALYYSAVSFSSLGGSPLPTPELRLLTAIEALTGLILIAWTASFLFLMMQRAWYDSAP